MSHADQCQALNTLAEKLDISTFIVNESDCGGRGGGMGGGRTGGRGPVRCYNCDQEGHVAKDCLIPRRPWCSKCWVNAHTTEDCTGRIGK